MADSLTYILKAGSYCLLVGVQQRQIKQIRTVSAEKFSRTQVFLYYTLDILKHLVSARRAKQIVNSFEIMDVYGDRAVACASGQLFIENIVKLNCIGSSCDLVPISRPKQSFGISSVDIDYRERKYRDDQQKSYRKQRHDHNEILHGIHRRPPSVYAEKVPVVYAYRLKVKVAHRSLICEIPEHGALSLHGVDYLLRVIQNIGLLQNGRWPLLYKRVRRPYQESSGRVKHMHISAPAHHGVAVRDFIEEVYSVYGAEHANDLFAGIYRHRAGKKHLPVYLERKYAGHRVFALKGFVDRGYRKFIELVHLHIILRIIADDVYRAYSVCAEISHADKGISRVGDLYYLSRFVQRTGVVTLGHPVRQSGEYLHVLVDLAGYPHAVFLSYRHRLSILGLIGNIQDMNCHTYRGRAEHQAADNSQQRHIYGLPFQPFLDHAATPLTHK